MVQISHLKHRFATSTFWVEVAGIGDFTAVLDQSVIVDFEGSLVRILSINGLITAKETAGRKKDQAGLEELYALRDALQDESE